MKKFCIVSLSIRLIYTYLYPALLQVAWSVLMEIVSVVIVKKAILELAVSLVQLVTMVVQKFKVQLISIYSSKLN